MIDIETRKRSRIKSFFQNFLSRLENTAFSIIQKIPEKFLPHWFMESLERYLDKRLNELKRQSIKMAWQNVSLQKTVDDIHSRRQDMKKHLQMADPSVGAFYN